MMLNHPADSGQNRGDVFPIHPSAATGVENRFKLFDHKAHITATPEHGRDHPRERHSPGEMLHIFGIDEDFKRPAVPVEQQVIHRDVKCMLAVGPFHLIGLPLQRLGAAQRLADIDHICARIGLGRFLALL